MLSPADALILETQQQRSVDYAGPLAGYRVGVHQIGCQNILVTESPRLIAPVAGDWPTLDSLLTGLFMDEVGDQRPYFNGWVKVALDTLHRGVRRPGQALAMAGPHDCGKSLLQNLVTILLGGRQAKPYQYMTGGSPFNADLFGAEHLMIEDDMPSTDIRARRNFGSHLKSVTVNDVQRCHAKNRTPVSLTPFWRLTITINDEPENLMVLPPVDDSIADKIILLRANKRPMPMPTGTLDERHKFWDTLVAELPAYAHWLLHVWDIPTELLSQRFGITHFHHPDILRSLDDLAPEMRLMSLIDGELFKSPTTTEWNGTADELERRLTGSESTCQYEARRLFSFNTAAGVYLGRLAKKQAERVNQRRAKGIHKYTISAP
jgi:hypothetical protein